MSLNQKEIDAFNHVKNTIATLATEYKTTKSAIAEAERQLAELPLQTVPFDDFKAAIVDFVGARGNTYLREKVKPLIVNFATHHMSGTGVVITDIGKPLQYHELERAINGDGSSLSVANFLANSGAQFNDHVLHALFGDLVKVALAKVMDELTEDDFGYNKLRQSEVGTDRATRRIAIQEAENKLAVLREKKQTLANNLGQLGIPVNDLSIL